LEISVGASTMDLAVGKSVPEAPELNKETPRQGAGRLPTFHSTLASPALKPSGSLPSKIQSVAVAANTNISIASASAQPIHADSMPETLKHSNWLIQDMFRPSKDLASNFGRAKVKQVENSEVIDWPTSVHELQRSLSQASEKLERSEDEARQLKRHIVQLQDSLEQRDFELTSRPTHRYVQQLKNEVSKLERQLHPDRETLRKNTRTLDLVRRDKRKQSLNQKRQAQGLSAISDISKEELERTLSTVCTTLRAFRLEDIERTTQHLADIVEQHLPHLEQFAGKVFKLVQEGDIHKSPHDSVTATKSKLTAGKVFAQLCAWRDGVTHVCCPSCRTKSLREQTRLSSHSWTRP